jgi:hypothetical protein
VLELWSLFDFLMPGFLGTSKQFSETYSKPITASKDAKSSSKEQEAGMCLGWIPVTVYLVDSRPATVFLFSFRFTTFELLLTMELNK